MKKFFWGLAGLLWLSAGTARADLYDVQNIPVFAELDDALAARTAAIANGQTDAFWALMKKMVSAEDLGRVPMPGDNLNDWVQNVSLSGEKASATRYEAVLNVRFKPQAIRDMLTQNQIPFLTQAMPTTVVIPVLNRDSATHLLDDENPVYTFFKGQAPGDSFWDIRVPTGDLEDIALTQALLTDSDGNPAKALARKYDADEVMLLTVSVRGPYINVTARPMTDRATGIDNGREETAFGLTWPTGNITTAMPGIWQRIVQEQENTWRTLKTEDLSVPRVFWVSVPIPDLRTWRDWEKRLAGATYLAGFDVRGFRPGEVLITLKYKGDYIRLNALLNRQGLDLQAKGTGGLWTLSPLPQQGDEQ